MKTNEQENRTVGSFEIQERMGAGIARPSREVSQRDKIVSCTEDCAGREMDELEYARRHVKDVPAPQRAERETKLREPCIGVSRESESTFRKRVLVMREIPLLKISAALQRGVREKGGTVYRIGIVRSHLNYHTIKIRCNSKRVAEHYDQSQLADLVKTTVSSKSGDGA